MPIGTISTTRRNQEVCTICRDWLGRVVASSTNKMSGASIFLIVVLVIGAVIVAPVVWRMKKKRDKANARNGGLIEPIGGALA
jgi:membrane protein YdbS with pleckstrin-like domain